MAFAKVVCALLISCISGAASGTETTTFTYDALGRLVSVANAGGPRNGKTNATRFDPSGNRAASAVTQTLPPTPVDAAIFAISAPASVMEGNTALFTVTKSGTASNTLTVNYNTLNGTASSANTVLTFDAANCVSPPTCSATNGYGPFSQSYGDVANVVDVSHRAVSDWGNSSQVDASINYFRLGYGALNGVAWAGTDQNNTNHVPQFGEIMLRSLAGNGMTLNSIDTAGWAGANMNVTFRIYDLSYTELYSVTIVAPGSGSRNFDFGGITSPNGLIVQWGSDSFNSAIDNLSFTVGPVAQHGDYVAKAGTLSFLDWETSKIVSIPVINDGITEGPEQLSVVLSGPSSGASISTASAATTITAPISPPVANSDSATAAICRLAVTIDVLANDTDPGGNLPLTLVSVATSSMGTTSIVAGKVRYKANVAGADSVNYVIKNSANVFANGTIQMTNINDGGCQ